MLFTPEYSDPSRKAAISLNNSAVALISKGLLSEAMDTLKDSVVIMKLAAEASNPDGLCNMATSGVKETEPIWVTALHQAQQRLTASACNVDAQISNGIFLLHRQLW
jgi:hypothetical protein